MKYVAPILDGLEAVRQIPTVEALAGALRPEWIRDAIAECGRSSQRERLLPAALTAWIVILLGLFRRHSYANLLALLGEAPWKSAPWPADAPPSTRALVKARDRLGAEPLEILFRRSAAEWSAEIPSLLVGGFRVHALDGVTLLVPDSQENRAHFGAPASTRGRTGYPQMRAVALVDVRTRLVRAVRQGPFREGEMTLAKRLLPDIPRDAFVILDRLYWGYEFLHGLRAGRGAHFMIRLKKNVVAHRIGALGRRDFLVEVPVPRNLLRARPELPAVWILREISYRPRGSKEVVRVLTSCLDPLILSAAEAAALYHERWEAETHFDEVKTHQCGCAVVSRPTALRSLTPERIRQEFFGLMLAYDATRVLMARAGAIREVEPRRLSFTGALERIREAVRDMMWLATPRLVERFARLLCAVARATVPLRPGRKHPRAVKVKMSKYTVKRRAA